MNVHSTELTQAPDKVEKVEPISAQDLHNRLWDLWGRLRLVQNVLVNDTDIYDPGLRNGITSTVCDMADEAKALADQVESSNFSKREAV